MLRSEGVLWLGVLCGVVKVVLFGEYFVFDGVDVFVAVGL